MSLYKRGNIWWLEIDLPDGRRARETTGATDKAVAKQYHDKRKALLLSGSGDVKPTWDAAVSRWMRERSDKKSLNRDREIAEWLTRYWHGKLLTAISDLEVQAVMDEKREATSASNANHYLAFTRALFNIAFDKWKWVDRPLRVKPFRVNNKRVRFLTEVEMERLMKELPPHLSVMAEFSVLTGLRQANVGRLKWVNVDLNRRLVWIPSSEYKNGHMHSVPLNDRAIQILQSQEGMHETYVFTYKGSPCTRPNNTGWKNALKRAGIDDFRWHDLRHTFASYHAMNGTPLLTLKQLGGWRSLDMVNRYAHLSAESTRQWANNSTVATTT